MSESPKGTVLALYPTRRGIAYCLFDSPEKLVDFGIQFVQPMSNKKVMAKVREYLDHFKPDIVLCRSVNDQKKRCGIRTQNLINLICNQAKAQCLEVHSYTRTQIQNVFSQFGAYSKYQISQKLIEWYEPLKVFEFPVRKRWLSEHNNTGVFDAASLAIVLWFLET